MLCMSCYSPLIEACGLRVVCMGTVPHWLTFERAKVTHYKCIHMSLYCVICSSRHTHFCLFLIFLSILSYCWKLLDWAGLKWSHDRFWLQDRAEIFQAFISCRYDNMFSYCSSAESSHCSFSQRSHTHLHFHSHHPAAARLFFLYHECWLVSSHQSLPVTSAHVSVQQRQVLSCACWVLVLRMMWNIWTKQQTHTHSKGIPNSECVCALIYCDMSPC